MIDIQQLTFRYGRSRPLFQDLTLALGEGSVYGLLGRNGAGKTTLLKNMAGLLSPASGRCRVGGHTAAGRHPAFLRDVFFLPEEFYLPPVPVGRFVRTYAPFYPQFDAQQFRRYLAEFEIGEGETLTRLSYGQKKKVLIGFGLAANTQVLLMDEPTNGLDIPAKSQFRRLIASAIDDTRTIVISTHQVRDLESLIDPVIILDESEVLLHATIEQITEKLCFRNLAQAAPPQGLLYSESSFRGVAAVYENTGGEPGKVDLELLFHAALLNRSRIKEIFST